MPTPCAAPHAVLLRSGGSVSARGNRRGDCLYRLDLTSAEAARLLFSGTRPFRLMAGKRCVARREGGGELEMWPAVSEGV